MQGGVNIGPGASLSGAVFSLAGDKPSSGQALIGGNGPGDSPVVAGDVPQEPVAFQSRTGLLDALATESAPRLSVVSAVTGIRGVGKTQIVAGYARARIAQRWRVVAWVDAGNQHSLLAGLAEIAAALRIGSVDDGTHERAAQVRHWLESHGAQCLVVFDNAFDLDELRPYLPAAGDAQVVITSNRRAAAYLGQQVSVDVFSMAEALSFLAQRTGRTDGAGARKLAEELGCLPLGLAQAAAVITRERLDYGTYLQRLRELPATNYLIRVEGDPYPHGAAEAILLSLKSIEDSDDTGLCAAIMGLVSTMSEAGTPRVVLHTAAESGVLPYMNNGKDAAVGNVSLTSVDAAVGRLADASLLGFNLDGSVVVAHRLIMRVVREWCLTKGEFFTIATMAAKVLTKILRTEEWSGKNLAWALELTEQCVSMVEHTSVYVVQYFSRHREYNGPGMQAFDDMVRWNTRLRVQLNEFKEAAERTQGGRSG